MALSPETWAVYASTSLVFWTLSCFLRSNVFNTKKHHFPESVPVSGLRKEWFGLVRGSMRQLTAGVSTLMDGYQKYSRSGSWFLVCETSLDQELMVPPEHVRWLLEQPPAVMSSKTIREERHASGYLHIGVEFESTEFFLERIMRDRLTKYLDLVQEPMHDEIRHAFETELDGHARSGTPVKIFPTLQTVILKAICRVFYGPQLTQDRNFMTLYNRYILSMSIGTMVIGQLPRFLKSVVVPVINLPLWYYRTRTMKMLVPVVERRLANIDADSDPYDFISQCARVSQRISSTKTPAEPAQLAECMMLLGFAALNSLAVQATHVLLDILHCPAEPNLYEALREEAGSLLQHPDDWNNAESFHKMHVMDSAIRESLRVHPMLIKGLSKEVVPAEGVDLPGGTTHLAQGAWIGVPTLAIHRDERFYPNAGTYDPYRALRMREAALANKASPGKGGDGEAASDFDAGKPSTTYLGFGYGRRSCPGRWYAVLMIKTMMAHLVLNYNMEGIGSQPPLKTIGDMALPPMSSRMRIKKRATGLS